MLEHGHIFHDRSSLQGLARRRPHWAKASLGERALNEGRAPNKVTEHGTNKRASWSVLGILRLGRGSSLKATSVTLGERKCGFCGTHQNFGERVDSKPSQGKPIGCGCCLLNPGEQRRRSVGTHEPTVHNKRAGTA